MNEYPGSKWWKFDFHNHTPASLDYRGNKDLSPRQWLEDYKNKGIQCIVVTDHNSASWIDKLKNELVQLKQEDNSTWKNMAIFPGVELSCSSGVHLLAILDPSKEGSDIDAILGSVGYTGTRGDSDGVTRKSIQDIIPIIQEAGGIACAAHIDQPKGLLCSITDHHTLEAIFNLLDAVEIIDSNNSLLNEYTENLSHLASVLGSDSHEPSTIARGYTWIKMSNPSIEGLKLALLDPESSIKRSDEYPDYSQELNHSKIKKITIEKLRLRQKEPLIIHFNPSYNALIGGRGSGKSSVLECLRLGLARDNELLAENADGSLKQYIENFKKEKTGRHLPGMMLHDSKIVVEVSKGDGDLEERFEYCWVKGIAGQFTVSVKRWEGNDWQDTQLTEEQARSNFPVKIFSQKQILSLADNPQHLIQYIDDVLEDKKKTWERSFAEKQDRLRSAREKVRILEQKIVQKPAIELQYKEASRKARVFLSSDYGEAFRAYQRARKQEQTIKGFFEQLENYIQSMKQGVDNARVLNQMSLSDFEVSTDSEKSEEQNVIRLSEKISRSFKEIETLINTMEQELNTAKDNNQSSTWYLENQSYIDKYESIVEDLKNQGISNAEEATKATGNAETLRKQLDEIDACNTELEQSREAVNSAQVELDLERKNLTKLRQDFLDGVLKNIPNLKITLNAISDIGSGEVTLRDILRIENGFVKEIYSETDDNPSEPCGMLWDFINPKLASSVFERLQEIKLSLEEKSEQVLNTKLNGKFINKLKALKTEESSVVFDRLASWYPEDLVDIQYRRDKNSSFQSLQQASAGQRTAAMLSFLLAHGDEPLLMDQPEDDLDNALVSELVVTQLRNNKNRRQLIVITHNANIVVNGDADLVMPMEFIGGQIVNNVAGGLQERSIRSKICEIMEGGEKAFEQRYKRILRDMKR
ncbi:MAG: hypothetical protein Q4A74_08975 [Cardiobacteriaceae bacterium]|nr:hypothetical protein [Cardiobacteriaceae bacterium]